MSPLVAIQFDFARELLVVSTRYFYEDFASVNQFNGLGVKLHEKRQPIELTPTTPLRIVHCVHAEFSTSVSEEKTWVSDRKQIRPSESQLNA